MSTSTNIHISNNNTSITSNFTFYEGPTEFTTINIAVGDNQTTYFFLDKATLVEFIQAFVVSLQNATTYISNPSSYLSNQKDSL